MKGVIRIEGEIGSAVTLQGVRSQIDPEASEYEILLNSGGGEVFTGEDIYNELKSLKKPKTVIITGMCASIATLIAGAGDRRKMYEVGHWMIHNPSVGIEGDAHDHRKVADTLDHIKKVIVSVYEKFTKKAGILKDRLWQLLDEETWYTPEEALQMGFIDEIIKDHTEPVAQRMNLRPICYIDKNKLKTMSKEKENEGTLRKLSNIVNGMFKILRTISVKNMVNDTLEDGTNIIVMTEDENWEQKPVTYEDGSPLSAGEYTTASGVKFTVDENSTIITVAAPEAQPEEKTEDKPTEEEMKENEALKAEVAELKKQLEAKNSEAAKASEEAKVANENVKQFSAALKTVQAEIEKIKNTTVGDTDDPGQDAPDKKVEKKQDKGFDPMAGLGDAFLSSRPMRFN